MDGPDFFSHFETLETSLKDSMGNLSEENSFTWSHKGALLGHTSSCNGPRQNNHIYSNTCIPLPGDGRSFPILSRTNLPLQLYISLRC